MRIPSPDDALIALSGRVLARPQARGTPLPRIQARAEWGPPLAALMATATFPALGLSGFVPAYLALCAYLAWNAWGQARVLSAIAGRWDAGAVLDHRVLAAIHRQSAARARGWMLAGTVALSFLFLPSWWLLGWQAPLTPVLLWTSAMAALSLAKLYAYCVDPLDPDAPAIADEPMAASRPVSQAA